MIPCSRVVSSRPWRRAAALALLVLLSACGSDAQYQRNQRAMDEQMALGNEPTATDH